MEQGWLPPLRLGRYTLRIHVAFLIFLFVVGDFTFAPGRWFAWVFIVAVHELGHIFMIRRFKGIPMSTQVFFRGDTNYIGADGWREQQWVGSGGIIAQLLLIPVLGLTMFFTEPYFAAALDTGSLAWVTLLSLPSAIFSLNLFFVAIELIPYPPLDGVTFWALVKSQRRKFEFPRAGSKSAASPKSPERAKKVANGSRSKFVVVQGGKRVENDDTEH